MQPTTEAPATFCAECECGHASMALTKKALCVFMLDHQLDWHYEEMTASMREHMREARRIVLDIASDEERASLAGY